MYFVFNTLGSICCGSSIFSCILGLTAVWGRSIFVLLTCKELMFISLILGIVLDMEFDLCAITEFIATIQRMPANKFVMFKLIPFTIGTVVTVMIIQVLTYMLQLRLQ